VQVWVSKSGKKTTAEASKMLFHNNKLFHNNNGDYFFGKIFASPEPVPGADPGGWGDAPPTGRPEQIFCRR